MTNASVKEIRQIAPNIWSLLLLSDATFAYHAGQHVVLQLNDGLPPRAYSIASAPPPAGIEQPIELHIKRTAKGMVSQHVASKLKTGDTVTIKGPFGESFYDPQDKRPLLLLAGGAGIVPMKAILETAIRTQHSAPIMLYWGANAEKELYLADNFKALQRKSFSFKFRPVTGEHITTPLLNDFPTMKDIRIHMAGPPAMIKAIMPELVEKGADRKDIYFDPFE